MYHKQSTHYKCVTYHKQSTHHKIDSSVSMNHTAFFSITDEKVTIAVKQAKYKRKSLNITLRNAYNLKTEMKD